MPLNYLLSLALSFPGLGVAARCLPCGAYEIDNEYDLDAFLSDFPNRAEFEGSIKLRPDIFSEDDIFDFTGLSSLTSIAGDIDISPNNGLSSLFGLGGSTTTISLSLLPEPRFSFFKRSWQSWLVSHGHDELFTASFRQLIRVLRRIHYC